MVSSHILGQHCQPFFIHPASDVLSCNPYQKQCPLEFVCKVSGLMDPGYTLSWTSTNKNKTDKASVHKYEKIGGCYHLTSTLKLLEPMVSQGVYWCVVFAADGTQFLQSSPFSLLAPDHYSNLPACGCPTNESKTSYRDSKEHARKEIREVGMSEMSGSGQASTTEISITGTIVPLVVGSGSIMIFVICLLLAIVCIYCSYKKHRVHAMTELDSATVTGQTAHVHSFLCFLSTVSFCRFWLFWRIC